MKPDQVTVPNAENLTACVVGSRHPAPQNDRALRISVRAAQNIENQENPIRAFHLPWIKFRKTTNLSLSLDSGHHRKSP